jgi:putative transposase
MELFEDALERVRRRYLFVVAGYVAMPEHVHLLVNEPKGALLSRAIQALKLSVSMRSRERPFWQAHYYDFNVSSHEKFVEKLRYIHRNPVRRGLVAKPEDWAWSSFRHYQTGVRGTVEIESEWTARERGWRLPEWMRLPSPVPEGEGPRAPRTCKKTENREQRTEVRDRRSEIRERRSEIREGGSMACAVSKRRKATTGPRSTALRAGFRLR